MGDSEKIPKEIRLLLADMKRKLEESKGFSSRKIVDTEYFLQAIEDIGQNLPEQIDKAAEIYRDSEAIKMRSQKAIEDSREQIIKDQERAKKKIEELLAEAARKRNETIQNGEKEAKAIAGKILADAQARADEMVAVHTVTRRAHEEAARIGERAAQMAEATRQNALTQGRDIVARAESQAEALIESGENTKADAEEYSRQLKASANNHARNTMKTANEALTNCAQAISRSRQGIMAAFDQIDDLDGENE